MNRLKHLLLLLDRLGELVLEEELILPKIAKQPEKPEKVVGSVPVAAKKNGIEYTGPITAHEEVEDEQ